MTVNISTTSTRRALHTAGIAAIVAGVGYILIPVFRALVGAITGTELSTYPSPSEIPENTWLGISGAVLFGAMAVAVLVLTQAAASLHPDGVGSRLGAGAGVASAIGFFLAGACSAALYSWIAANLIETGADEGAQVAALWAINVLGVPPLALAAAGLCGWTWWLVHTGMIGRALAVVCAVLSSLIVLGIVGAAFLPAQFLYVPLFALLAIGMLRSARRSD